MSKEIRRRTNFSSSFVCDDCFFLRKDCFLPHFGNKNEYMLNQKHKISNNISYTQAFLVVVASTTHEKMTRTQQGLSKYTKVLFPLLLLSSTIYKKEILISLVTRSFR